MALGTAPRRLLGNALRQGMLPVGVVAGAGVALSASSLVARFLYGVARTDPASFVAAAVVLLIAGALAAFVPAYRVGATQPSEALRAE